MNESNIAAVSLALTELLKTALQASQLLAARHSTGEVANAADMRAANARARAALDAWDKSLDAQEARGTGV